MLELKIKHKDGIHFIIYSRLFRLDDKIIMDNINLMLKEIRYDPDKIYYMTLEEEK